MTIMTDWKEKYDPLISRLIFPQPASVFKFHLKAIEELKNDAIIVFDFSLYCSFGLEILQF